MKRIGLWLLLFPVCALAASPDRCAAQWPNALAMQLERAYPRERMPRSGDNLDEDVQYNLDAHGSGCLATTQVDVDGDGHADRVVAMPARRGDATRVVVALRRGRGWRTETLANWPHSQGRVFVDQGPAGRFRRSEALEGPVSQPGERVALRCPHPVVYAGFTGSSAAVFCRTAQGWRHVWISD